MAYGVLYEFHRTSTNGADMLITISQKGYSGAVKKRALGRAPVIKRDNNGHIYGTSCELYAECLVDGEFSHLYTSDAYEYKVEVYKNNTLLWAGFVSPELYSEPDIAPPYDVQIIATDGLGELKNYNFNKRGAASILDHINALMANTGIDMGFNVVSGLRYIDENGAASAIKDILNVKLDLDHEEGNSCYDVLQGILSSLNANITQHNGSYLIFRETDFITKAGAQGVEAFNVAGEEINLGVASFGTMKDNQWWPVGQLSTVIEPAKNQIVLTSPNHYKGNVLRFDNWTTSDLASFSEDENAYVLPGADSFITQTVDFGGHEVGYRLGLRVRARNVGASGDEEQNIGIKVEIDGRSYSAGKKFWLVKSASTSGRPINDYLFRSTEGTIEEDLPTPTDGATASDAQDIDIVLPLYRSGSRSYIYATNVKLTIFNPKGLYDIHVYDVSLVKYEQIKGYEANVTIDNKARESESNVDLTITAGDLAPAAGNVFMTGLPLRPTDSEVITKWQIGNDSAQDYLAIMAFDYSRVISLPRMKYSGILNVPGSATVLPTLFLRDGTYYFPKTYTYDLYSDEITVDLISISAADVSLSSVTISQTSEAAGTMGATTGGPSGGGGAVSIPRDKQMSDTSDNAVENKVIKKYVDDIFAPIGKWFSEISPMFGKMADGILKVSGNLVVTGDTSSGGGAGGGETQITGFLNDLNDVTIKSQVAGDLLVYNGIEWVNTPQSTIVPNLTGYATEVWVLGKNYLTGITSSMVTAALGYTPYNSANFTKANIKSTLGISDWALAASKPSYKSSEVTEETNLYFTNERAVAAVMGASAIGGTSAYIYWTGSAWASKALGSRAFDSTEYLPKAGGTLNGNLVIGGEVSGGGALQVAGIINSSSVVKATTRLRVNSSTHATVFGFVDAATYGSTNNRAVLRIGSCYGGAATLDNFTESTDDNGSTGVNMTTINIYRRSVGIGKRYEDSELDSLFKSNYSLGISKGILVDGASKFKSQLAIEGDATTCNVSPQYHNTYSLGSLTKSWMSIFLISSNNRSTGADPIVINDSRASSGYQAIRFLRNGADYAALQWFHDGFNNSAYTWNKVSCLNLDTAAGGSVTIGAWSDPTLIVWKDSKSIDARGAMNVSGNLSATSYDGGANSGTGANTSGKFRWGSFDEVGGLKLQFGATTGAKYEIINSAWNKALFSVTTEGDCTIGRNLLVTGEVASASDMRLKDVIEDRVLNVEDIAKAPYFSYRWKNSEYGLAHLGTSAQYWKEIASEYVVDGDIMTLNYASLGVGIGISLAKVAVDHEERIKTLEKENERLKKKINGIR